MWKYSYTQIGSEQFWAIQVDNTRKLPSNLLLSSTQRNQERSHTFSLISKLFGDSRYTHWLQKLWINPKIPEKFLLLPLPFSFWVFLLITFSVSSFTWSCPADLCSSQSASASSPLESVWTRKAWDTTHSLSFNTTVTSSTTTEMLGILLSSGVVRLSQQGGREREAAVGIQWPHLLQGTAE